MRVLTAKRWLQYTSQQAALSECMQAQPGGRVPEVPHGIVRPKCAPPVPGQAVVHLSTRMPRLELVTSLGIISQPRSSIRMHTGGPSCCTPRCAQARLQLIVAPA